MAVITKKRTNGKRKPWGCPLTKNRSSWCFALCNPENQIGECGRVAFIATVGRTDRAILEHKQKKELEEADGEE